jgi:hypothetical protein
LTPSLRSVQLPGHGQLPLPPLMHADRAAAWAMIILLYAGFAAALLWAGYKLVRQRDVVPAILVIAGVAAANIEPLGDHVGLIEYAPNIPWFHYWVMGRRMPSFIAVAECAYVALGSYYASRLIEGGRSLKSLAFISAVLIGIPEIVMEVLWHHWGIIDYYGHNPSRILGIPLYSIVQNSTLLPFYGVVTYLCRRYLRGAQQLWLIPFIPTATIGYIVGVSWPVYLAIQSSAAGWIVWMTTLVVCVTSIAVTYAALQLPMVRERRELRDTPGKAAEPRRATFEPVPQ